MDKNKAILKLKELTTHELELIHDALHDAMVQEQSSYQYWSELNAIKTKIYLTLYTREEKQTHKS